MRDSPVYELYFQEPKKKRVNMGQYTEVAATVLELDEVRLGG